MPSTLALHVLLFAVALALPACGVRGQNAETGADLQDAAVLGVADAGAPADSSWATTLATLLPVGQCPSAQGSLLSIVLDGNDLDGLNWLPGSTPGPGLVWSDWYAPSNDSDVAFSASAPYATLAVGSWNAASLRASAQFEEQPSFTCSGSAVTGVLEITKIVKGPPSAYQDQACGIFDFTCAASGHTLHVRATFNEAVSLGTGPGH